MGYIQYNQIRGLELKKIIIAAAFFIVTHAFSGPLGLRKGMTLEELKKQGTFTPMKEKFRYESKSLANGHPDFAAYFVTLTPEHGLCKVEAIGKVMDSNSYGTELEGKYKDLLSAVKAKYGAPAKEFNFIPGGSIWRDPRDWMMSLMKTERHLTAFWAPPETQNLPDSLNIIMIKAMALSQSQGFIVLGYEFDNSVRCREVIRAKKNSNL